MYHLESEILHASRTSFVVLLNELADLEINTATNLAAFHAFRVYRLEEWLLKNLYDLFEKSNNLMKSILPELMKEKLAKVSDERRTIEQLYLKNLRLFEYDPGNKKKRLTENATTREEQPVSKIRKQLDENVQESSGIQGGKTGAFKLTDKSTRTSNRTGSRCLTHLSLKRTRLSVLHLHEVHNPKNGPHR